MISRRDFIKVLIFIKSLLLSYFSRNAITQANDKIELFKDTGNKTSHVKINLGVNIDGMSEVIKVIGGSPKENMVALVEKLGGIEKIVGIDDIVVLKPNAQWWAQGMTNTDAMRAFIEMILTIDGFTGEIIIAENHQYLEYSGRGWSTDQPNGKFNYNDLIEYFNRLGYKNVSAYHWRGCGPNPEPLEGDDGGYGKRVAGPEDGDGYVWRDDIVYTTPEGRQCWMTYPIFTSRYSGITIDLMNGAWLNGNYLNERNVRFINFSAINHHSFYCGITASVKNLMGVVDMTCGFHAPTPEGTYNVHFIGVKNYVRLSKKIPTRLLKKLRSVLYKRAYKNFHYTGGALGHFMKNIRIPDLNIITAHWVGWGSRWAKEKSSYPRALLASHDPVALDYVAAKDVVLPETPPSEDRILRLNNPDLRDGPLYTFLRECHLQGIGNLSEGKIRRIEIEL